MCMSSIAEQLMDARKTRGLTIEELAIKVGSSDVHIRNIEKALEQPDLSLIEKIACELNYTFHIGNVSI
jgi:transcriptional regulator with XRE-family HTH domain